MAQPKDFYQGKQAALKELQDLLRHVIDTADDYKWYEEKVADNPDTAGYTVLTQKLNRSIRYLNHLLGNVERKMHE